MLNKNVADYTNFDGKTNKKIVQAPGGASSFSLAWSNEKTDYGPERNSRKDVQKPYQQYQPPQPYQQPPQNYPSDRPNYSEPIRVMDDAPYGYGRNQAQGYGGGGQDKIGGEYGYKGYGNGRQSTDGGYGQSTPTKPGHYGGYKNEPVEQLDIALQQQTYMKKRPPSVPHQSASQNQARSCIKINAPPRQNLIFGGNDYNYWKEDTGATSGKRESEKRIPQQSYGNRPPEYQQERTSVRVHNPPGGKQSFTLG